MKRYVFPNALFLLSFLPMATASASILYSTSFESPEFTPGQLEGQNGYSLDFGGDATVTAAFQNTGNQSLVVTGAGFGQPRLNGPFATAAPQLSVKRSVYLDETADWSDSFITMGLGGDNGFFAQLAIRNGTSAVMRPENDDLFATPITLGEWIDLELVLDFPTQTLQGFVDGVAMGTAGFGSPTSELNTFDFFYIKPDASTFYLDDVSITAIPEPGSVILVGGLAALGLFALSSRYRLKFSKV